VIEEKFPEPLIKPELYRPKEQYQWNYCGPVGCKLCLYTNVQFHQLALNRSSRPDVDLPLFLAQFLYDFRSNFEDVLCNLDTFRANFSALVVALAAPVPMRFIHDS
jgi:hypothetical protein